MDKENDPYMGLINIMRKEGAEIGSVSFFIGEVVSVAPLMVKFGEICVSQEDMMINQYLLKGHKRSLSLALTMATGISGNRSGGSYNESFSSHNHDMNTLGIPSGEFTTLDDFYVGEKVLMLMSADQQTIILVCKLG
ncbi:DUF2577 family protein [Anaerotignum sp. MB30-C6]|uniref:DUF2577 family protein n=1 Tax=Anaerotignum sp. MB30-C6 TaxID=3070814 RepID=UPI0027DBEE96|nr:DUF2577 family protein [Anaerotignum sp. MB30-C6]WMI81604.1 DUF2577 family protein [Anaerotignum sp. MB30-C6]